MTLFLTRIHVNFFNNLTFGRQAIKENFLEVKIVIPRINYIGR